MSIKDNIKKYRKQNKLTQKQLADKIGKKEITIRKYENGDIIPPLQVIKDMAKVFNIPINKIDNSIDIPTPKSLKNAMIKSSIYIYNNGKSPLDILKEYNDHSYSFSEYDLIEMFINDYNDYVFNNKYECSNLKADDIGELKPVIRWIIETFLKNKCNNIKEVKNNEEV